jgi:protein SCO1/2
MTVFVDPKPLREFVLTDQNRNAFDLDRLKGNWSFLFFGYTHCPDICPSTLASLSKLREQLTKGVNGSKNIQFIFISVDPKRDTAAILKQYTGYFDPSIVGVTGSELELRKLTGQLGALFELESAPDKESYQVYHTSALFLINPQGQYVASLMPPFDISTINRRFIVLKKINAMSSPP